MGLWKSRARVEDRWQKVEGGRAESGEGEMEVGSECRLITSPVWVSARVVLRSVRLQLSPDFRLAGALDFRLECRFHGKSIGDV